MGDGEEQGQEDDDELTMDGISSSVIKVLRARREEGRKAGGGSQGRETSG